MKKILCLNLVCWVNGILLTAQGADASGNDYTFTTLAGFAQDINGDGLKDGGSPDGMGSAARFNWCWGVEAFRKELLAQVEERRGASHYGEELQESATEKTERLVRQELEKLGWTEAELGARRKGDRAKLKLAVKLRAETTMTLKWIAARLQMGTGASLSNLLSAQRRKGR